MSTRPDFTRAPVQECPLHSAMREIAQLATEQHIFYLEGECLPRPDLLRRLQTWSLLHQVVSTRLCPANRDTPLHLEELESIIEAIRSRLRCPDTADSADVREASEELYHRRLSATLFSSEACARATSCPLHTDEGGKESHMQDATQGRQP
jgi:hypothetical protein